jgi:hypothetical protein
MMFSSSETLSDRLLGADVPYQLRGAAERNMAGVQLPIMSGKRFL